MRMNVTWVHGLFFFSTRTYAEHNLVIIRNEQPITMVNRTDLSIYFPFLPIIVWLPAFLERTPEGMSAIPVIALGAGEEN
jgi:hypothetical protein